MQNPQSQLTELKVGGVTPLTSIDYPGELAAVIFCQGCPWRCSYCQNAHLLPRSRADGVEWAGVVDFLSKRRGLLDAVVFSGGEPTLQKALPEAIRQVRQMGFKIGLHTAGCYPEQLKRVLALVDWVGMDIKALPDQYPAITQTPGSGERAWESLDVIQAASVDYEVRTTRLPGTPDALILDLSRALSERGVELYALQACRTIEALDPALKNTLSAPPSRQLVKNLQRLIPGVVLR